MKVSLTRRKDKVPSTVQPIHQANSSQSDANGHGEDEQIPGLHSDDLVFTTMLSSTLLRV